MKVLVATDKPFAKVAVDGIRKEIEAAGYELVLLEKYGEKAKLLEAVKDANAIIIRSDIIDAEVLDAAKELKIVVRAGAGYDNVDLEAATAHNVCVMNTPGQNSNAVAELAFGLMVMAVRNMYNGTSGTELMGKKLGIHAYGNVGRNVARIAKGFCMEIYAFDAFPERSNREGWSEGCGFCRRALLYLRCRFPAYSCNCRNEEFHQLCIGEQDAEGRTAGEHSP